MKRMGRWVVEVFCGPGNNGGDGLAIARLLHERQVLVHVVPCWDREPIGDAGINWQIVQRMKLPIITFPEHQRRLHPDLRIDALFGTGLVRAIADPIDSYINHVLNAGRVPVLAIDIPSGLDCDTGEPLGPCIRATRTITFASEKAGFANPRSREFTGEVSIGDIGIPPELIAAVTSP